MLAEMQPRDGREWQRSREEPRGAERSREEPRGSREAAERSREEPRGSREAAEIARAPPTCAGPCNFEMAVSSPSPSPGSGCAVVRVWWRRVSRRSRPQARIRLAARPRRRRRRRRRRCTWTRRRWRCEQRLFTPTAVNRCTWTRRRWRRRCRRRSSRGISGNLGESRVMSGDLGRRCRRSSSRCGRRRRRRRRGGALSGCAGARSTHPNLGCISAISRLSLGSLQEHPPPKRALQL